MKKIIYFFLFFQILYNFSFSSEFVNLKYLEYEKGVKVKCDFADNSLQIIRKGKTVKLFFNYPFLLCDDCLIKIDHPPFCDNEKIFLTQYAYEKIVWITDNKLKNTFKIEKKEKIKNDNFKETEQLPPQKIVSKNTGNKKANKIVVIDPGHGGEDPGAIGKKIHLLEKEITLKIAAKVKKYIKNQNVIVFLTRENDVFVPLKQRALFANKLNADLFVSIHCNSSRNSNAKGTRTYIYSRIASSKDAEEAAKFENKDVGIFEFLLNDLKKNAYEYLSVETAGYIQHSLAKILKFKWHPTERAPFYVIANTNMPSVLVEVAFISNPEEERKLNSDYFIDDIARGIADGIEEYFQRMQ